MDRSAQHPDAEIVRQTCLRAAVHAYEDAKIRGLCAEGAWECAVDAMRALRLDKAMHIRIKRVYDEPTAQDGTRVLVDRLWPRGLSKGKASVDVWAKDVAPSTVLRQWFGHDPDRFDEFAGRYRRELNDNPDAVNELLGRIDLRKRLTLLTATADLDNCHASVLQDLLEKW
jgi:DNA-3-methyladenine glycosylase